MTNIYKDYRDVADARYGYSCYMICNNTVMNNKF